MGAAPNDDPYAYMEEMDGAKALAFARAENDRSLPVLQKDPRYAGFYADALKIATASDRIPGVAFAGDGSLRDFWQDAEHVRGIWRTISVDGYRSAAPPSELRHPRALVNRGRGRDPALGARYPALALWRSPG